MEFLADDVRYEVPVRVTHEGLAGWELAPTSQTFDDIKQTLEVWVRRLETDFAWAEQPRSRTRHHITDVIVDPAVPPGEYLVSSNCFVCRSPGDEATLSLFSLFRKDTLRRTGAGWRPARRRAALDQSMVKAHSMSISI
ncbi:aromatic-ring-hydroxylating dioxygenase subunit beta [Streptomyces sp. NPDC056930]|uniref:aromatic-ring-hydroxylating dioxygenase subunit beta n=1 Tax=Streptomyces sp. NPDC056930 TaxID=3345967 RepID=UPI00362C83D7